MKYLQTFKNLDEFNTYFPEGLVPSGILVYVKEEEKVIFSTNNIDGEFKKYEATIGDGGASQDEIDELLGQIEALQNDKEALETAKTELEAVVSAKDGEISTLEADKADLEAQVEELSANQEKHEFTFDDETKTLYINTKIELEPISWYRIPGGSTRVNGTVSTSPIYLKVSDWYNGDEQLINFYYDYDATYYDDGSVASDPQLIISPTDGTYTFEYGERMAEYEYDNEQKNEMDRLIHENVFVSVVTINGDKYIKIWNSGVNIPEYNLFVNDKMFVGYDANKVVYREK